MGRCCSRAARVSSCNTFCSLLEARETYEVEDSGRGAGLSEFGCWCRGSVGGREAAVGGDRRVDEVLSGRAAKAKAESEGLHEQATRALASRREEEAVGRAGSTGLVGCEAAESSARLL